MFCGIEQLQSCQQSFHICLGLKREKDKIHNEHYKYPCCYLDYQTSATGKQFILTSHMLNTYICQNYLFDLFKSHFCIQHVLIFDSIVLLLIMNPSWGCWISLSYDHNVQNSCIFLNCELVFAQIRKESSETWLFF